MQSKLITFAVACVELHWKKYRNLLLAVVYGSKGSIKTQLNQLISPIIGKMCDNKHLFKK